ncbi:hypothetical protein Gotri_011350 [Gossypium trilobum]|uniref:UBX domain-containing protein n=1 Tax=Gossypium trilobum TaxID=34281 RepID=A0A7J9EV34_9ROSI|nr:hypothetical protein [Gossypium trilobum]
MERSESFSSLTFKGSIPEAILEAKIQKKLFVVYISGEDSESKNMEDSTWTDLKFREGMVESSYPGLLVMIEFRTIPQLETTAAVLSAALASKKYESSSSGSSTVSQPEQGSSSSASVPSTTMANVVQTLESNPSVMSVVMEENRDCEQTVKEKNPELVENGSSESFSTDNLANIVDEQCDITNEEMRTVVSSVTSSPAVHASSHPEDDCLIPVKGTDHQPSCPAGSMPVSAAEAEKDMPHVKDKVDGALENTTTANIPTDVHLNIRLPDSSSLQEKFPVTYTLSMIKDYVDRNQSNGMGSDDLAIPYPRRLFGDREALIVVPRRRTAGFQGQRPSDDNRNLTPIEDSAGSSGGYFSYIKSFLSYVNPFAYLGGGASSSTTGQESQSGIWEYRPYSEIGHISHSSSLVAIIGPNPTVQNNLGGRNRSTSTASDCGRNRRPVTTQHGSNIHTLKRDEDDDSFTDRNPFWNGNSTQYGGSSDSK